MATTTIGNAKDSGLPGVAYGQGVESSNLNPKTLVGLVPFALNPDNSMTFRTVLTGQK